MTEILFNCVLYMNRNTTPYYYHNQMGGFINLNPKIISWKPPNTSVGVISGSIRPLTNKDYTNNTIYKHGMSRPLKIYRIGKKIANQRFVNSSISANGIKQTIDAPSLSTTTTDNNMNISGIPICVSDSIPQQNYLTNNPEYISCSKSFCCNPQYKAKRMSYSANTKTNNTYFSNTGNYLYKRKKLYSQNSFHYLSKKNDIQVSSSASIPQIQLAKKSGGPLSTWNDYQYISNNNCISNQCNTTIYKPNNYTYASQGAVDDRTRLITLIKS